MRDAGAVGASVAKQPSATCCSPTMAALWQANAWKEVTDTCASVPRDLSSSGRPWREQVEEDEEELQPPARPSSAAAATASAAKAPDGKPPARTFLPVEEDDDDPGLIPDGEQIRCGAAI